MVRFSTWSLADDRRDFVIGVAVYVIGGLAQSLGRDQMLVCDPGLPKNIFKNGAFFNLEPCRPQWGTCPRVAEDIVGCLAQSLDRDMNLLLNLRCLQLRAARGERRRKRGKKIATRSAIFCRTRHGSTFSVTLAARS